MLTELAAGTEYVDFCVTAVNCIGESKRCAGIPSLFTPSPKPPGKPTHCHIVSVGSTSMELHWAPPLHYGGSALDEYVISYRAPMHRVIRGKG